MVLLFKVLRRPLSAAAGRAVSFPHWIEAVAPTLKPPVANKLLFGDGQLKVMVVGGPNQRKDYHLQDGEELFLQLTGDMRLDVVEQGRFKEVAIPEGCAFLLPPRVPHSPQRFEGSVGIVFEREHLLNERDGLRWYTDNTPGGSAEAVGVQYEEYFHCTDLGNQLKPIIERFNARAPDATPVVEPEPPTTPDGEVATTAPVVIEDWLADQRRRLASAGAVVSFLCGAEFHSEVRFGPLSTASLGLVDRECFLWQSRGTSELTTKGADGPVVLNQGDMYLRPVGVEMDLTVFEGGEVMLVHNATVTAK